MTLELKTVGADPEVFITHKGKVVSAIGKLGGTKKEPRSMGVDGFYIQEDNVLAEFNIPPSHSEDEFVHNMATGVRLVKFQLGEDYDIKVVGSSLLDPKELKHPKAAAFGCEPDFNAWTGEEQVSIAPIKPIRTAAGHLHIGYNPVTEETNIQIAKALDLFLGLGSVILDPDTERRSVYGSAGSIRHKSYGFEYRTLSCFWINSPELCRWVYKQVKLAFEFVNTGGVAQISDIYDVMFAINFSDIPLAKQLMSKYNIKLPGDV
jgi:hypothetical protein